MEPSKTINHVCVKKSSAISRLMGYLEMKNENKQTMAKHFINAQLNTWSIEMRYSDLQQATMASTTKQRKQQECPELTLCSLYPMTVFSDPYAIQPAY